MRESKLYDMIESYIVKNKEAHYRTAYSYVKNKEDALDIVQESIYKAFKSIDSLENADYMKTWFYKILVNTALDFLRKSGRVSYVEDIVLDINSDSKEDTYEDFDLTKAMDSLPAAYKSIIVLKYFEDMKLEDIAFILGENLNTVKTRLYTGLKKLRIKLEA